MTAWEQGYNSPYLWQHIIVILGDLRGSKDDQVEFVIMDIKSSGFWTDHLVSWDRRKIGKQYKME